MRIWSEFRVRLRSIFFQPHVDAEVREELRDHIERDIEARVSAGVPPSEARRLAHLDFGSKAVWEEECRESHGVQLWQEFIADTRYALRTLLRERAFAAAAIATLALGIGANTTFFSVLDAVLFKPLPFANPNRIVAVWEKPPKFPYNSVSAANFLDWKAKNQVFDQMAAFTARNFALSGDHQPRKILATSVTANYFDLLGVRAARGRTFSSDEDLPGNEHVVVLTHRFWQTQLGGDPAVLQRKLTLDRETYVVTGVLPPNPSFDNSTQDIFVPLLLRNSASNRRDHFLNVIARLKDGVSIAQADADLKLIADGIAQTYPESNKGWGVLLLPLRDQLVGSQLQKNAIVLFGAVCLVLLIACTNVGSLTLARAIARKRELAVRAAVGATRSRIARQLLTECLVVVLAGTAAGILLSKWLLSSMGQILPAGTIPPGISIALDWRVLLFAVAVACVATALLGLAPAISGSQANPNDALHDRAESTSSGGNLRQLVIVSEFAIAFVLLAGSGLLVRTLIRLQRTNVGFDASNVLTAHISLPERAYDSPEKAASFFDEAVRRIASVPGVQKVGVVTDLPLIGWSFGEFFEVEGHPVGGSANRPGAHLQAINPDYFATLSIPLLKGRIFTSADHAKAPAVAIVNETFANRYLPGEDPIGKSLVVGSQNSRIQIVGVVGNVRVYGLGSSLPPANAELYRPFAQEAAPETYFAIRTSGDPMSFANAVQQQIWSIDKNQPVTELRTLQEVVGASVQVQRLNAGLLTAFGALALLLATVGIYGILSYAVASRTREIGIRIAIGGTPRTVVKMFLINGMRLSLIGVALGCVLAEIVTQFLKSMLFGLSPSDPISFLVAAATLLLASVLACYLPARRAAAIEPMKILRAS